MFSSDCPFSRLFVTSMGRGLLVDLNAGGLTTGVKWLCSVPALLLAGLFYFDHNISVRVVNSPENKLKKPPAYNLDMLALSFITLGLSLTGLPWMCGATVQSMAHTKALTATTFDASTGLEGVSSVVETRAAGLATHALIAVSLLLLPLLRQVPIPIASSGVFLYLGRKLVRGNAFVLRVSDCLSERARLPPDHAINTIGRGKAAVYTLVQALCLAMLWILKGSSRISILFPAVIGLLMVTRAKVLPRFFKENELRALGDEVAEAD